MRVAAGLVCAVAVAAVAVAAPGVAGAQPARCMSGNGATMTIIDGATACGTETDPTGTAVSYGDHGVGYAKADAGASAVGVGLAGGVGASHGTGGVATAFGFGPDSVAITSVDGGTVALALALTDSQALVADRDQGVVCQGGAAFAWNAAANRFCLATPAGTWSDR